MEKKSVPWRKKKRNGGKGYCEGREKKKCIRSRGDMKSKKK